MLNEGPQWTAGPTVRATTKEAGRRDAALAEDVHAVLSSHRHLNGCSCSIDVHGGVAHVRGQVSTATERRLLRECLGRIKGIHAVWDRVRVAGEPAPRILDIGCGPTKQFVDALGLDGHAHPGVDAVTDLEGGLPIRDGCLDKVFAVHFLEHIRNLVGLMNDIHRVLRPGGMLHVMVPHCHFVNAIADPTHTRFFHPQTFKYFCRPQPGVLPFRPLAIGASTDNIYADLQPVKPGEAMPGQHELARYFD